MSNDLFPSLAGETFPRVKVPRFSTVKHVSDTFRSWRAARAAYPSYVYKLTYSHLTPADFDTLVGFFKKRRGSFESFLLDDRDDGVVLSPQIFGIGDGARTQFPLVRTAGGFTEPVGPVNGTPVLRRTDWRGQVQLAPYARANLALQSEAFNATAWGKTGISVLADAGTAPSGQNTADQLVESAGAGFHGLHTVAPATITAGAVCTLSVYAYPYTRRYLQLVLGEGANGVYATYDVLTGTVTQSAAYGAGASLAASVVSLGGGWQRLILSGSGTPGGTSINGYLRMSDVATPGASPSYAGDGTSGLVVFGAQMEHGPAATAYVATTSSVRVITDYALDQYGQVTLGEAPPVAAVVDWAGHYFWRCNFVRDEIELSEFVRQLWELKSLDLETVKP